MAPPAVPGTSLGAGLERLARDGLAVARLVLVTDGYENRPPRLTPPVRPGGSPIEQKSSPVS